MAAEHRRRVRGHANDLDPALSDICGALLEDARDPEGRQAVLTCTPRDIADRLGRALSDEEAAWVADVLASARALCLALAETERSLDTLNAALDATRTGVIAIDARGTICYLNRTAATLLGASLGSRLEEVESALEALSVGEAAVGATTVCMHRVSSTRTLEFRKLGQQETHRPVTGAGPIVALTVVAVDTAAAPNVSMVMSALGITRAEGRLCVELARGRTVAEAAQNLGIKLATARSQLSSVFGKTGTRRQAELMRLLSALPTDAE